jgi:hypothetical protein
MGIPQPADDNMPLWEAEVRALEERNRLAFLATDVETLKSLWSNQLLVNSPVNRVHSKEQVLQLLEAGVIRHNSLECHIEFITRHVDVVVVMGHDRVTETPEGPTIHRRFTNIWQAAHRSWLLIARQATIISQPPDIS